MPLFVDLTITVSIRTQQTQNCYAAGQHSKLVSSPHLMGLRQAVCVDTCCGDACGGWVDSSTIALLWSLSLCRRSGGGNLRYTRAPQRDMEPRGEWVYGVLEKKKVVLSINSVSLNINALNIIVRESLVVSSLRKIVDTMCVARRLLSFTPQHRYYPESCAKPQQLRQTVDRGGYTTRGCRLS